MTICARYSAVDASMPRRKRDRRFADVSKEDAEHRNIRRRLNAEARAARHANRENPHFSR